ncbi:hypothetical protein DRN74_00040 [Candidatus Micrarchaeota archaeon]|nr:MAG: hypothetical protein DRN74_00040 [Candidatus Micrarchaeota archaeon]
MKINIDRKSLLIMVSGLILLLIDILFLLESPYFQNLVIISIMVISAPLLIRQYLEYRRIKLIERYLPDFLRDVAEARKSGMPLIRAIQNASKGNYGPLTEEMKKVSNQLSWGVSLEEALRKFMERVNSKFVKQAVLIIIEAYKSGGEISNILETVSTDIETLKEMESERKSKLKIYTYSMYMIFLLFLMIIIVLAVTFIPATPELASVAKIMGGQTQEVAEADFLTLFFHLALIEAVFAGLISGQMGEGSIIAGIKHSVILVVITMLVFSFFISQAPFSSKIAEEIIKSPPGVESTLSIQKIYVLDKDVSSMEIIEELRKKAPNPEVFSDITPNDVFFRAENCKPCSRGDIEVRAHSIKVNKASRIHYIVKQRNKKYYVSIGGE